MLDKTKLLIPAAIIIAGILYAYFNPYQSCKRDLKKAYQGQVTGQALSIIASKECSK